MDQETNRLIEQAPLQARIGEALDRAFSSLPQEARALIEQHGARVGSARRLKVSFHATFLAELSPPLEFEGTSHKRVIVQVLGSELGDKPFWGQPVEGATIIRASELASRAGVRVPRIFAVGRCMADGVGELDFVVEEFVETQTVEDEVRAPSRQWHRIADEVQAKLCSLSLSGADTKPLPHFESLGVQLQWLLTQVPAWDADLQAALALFTEGVVSSPPAALPEGAVLLHQDVNDGNLLCSERPAGSGTWELDSLIDWESATAADPRSHDGADPWRSARRFSLVVKGSYLAELYVRNRLPRCELCQLVEGYDNAAHGLHEAGWLSYQTWAARVELAGAAARAGL